MAYICLYVSSLTSALPQTESRVGVNVTNSTLQHICLEDDYQGGYTSHNQKNDRHLTI